MMLNWIFFKSKIPISFGQSQNGNIGFWMVKFISKLTINHCQIIFILWRWHMLYVGMLCLKGKVTKLKFIRWLSIRQLIFDDFFILFREGYHYTLISNNFVFSTFRYLLWFDRPTLFQWWIWKFNMNTIKKVRF